MLGDVLAEAVKLTVLKPLGESSLLVNSIRFLVLTQELAMVLGARLIRNYFLLRNALIATDRGIFGVYAKIIFAKV